MMRRVPVVLAVLLSAGIASVYSRPETTDAASAAVQVSWDFGSGPGRTSNFYVGKRLVPVQYDTPNCMSRFTLERGTYEFAEVVTNGKYPGGKYHPGHPPYHPYGA